MCHPYTPSRGRWPALGGVIAILAAAVLLNASGVSAARTPEAICQYGRAVAAGKYAQCAQNALATFDVSAFTGPDVTAYATRVGACVTKYAATWSKLQAKASGSGATCANPRFADNSDGTITDRLTGLQWEKKTNLDGTQDFVDPHDADNTYSWSVGGLGYTAADGTVFMDFLATLNSGPCFAEQCDWRLPTREELLTIVSPAYPACTTAPCLDPVFGPALELGYWSATTLPTNQNDAWIVRFTNGIVDVGQKSIGAVRAVRSGS
jgi:hypothetical protein